jgi:hypothetical protein
MDARTGFQAVDFLMNRVYSMCNPDANILALVYSVIHFYFISPLSTSEISAQKFGPTTQKKS